jgi:perosamine synthetase
MALELAIDGGKPTRVKLLPYGRQWIDDDDIAAVVEVLRSDWLTTGPKVVEFEKAFAAQVGAKYAVAVSSGTAALHAAVFAAGIGSGDEVIVTPMTFAASANCVRFQGGTVVFADVRQDTLSLDPGCVEAAITPRTRAIITVDYTGQPSDLDELNAIAERHRLMVIEDAAHALGATFQGRRVGGLTHLTTFSLHPVKHITTGEGGVITTNDEKLAERLRLFRNHGITSDHRQREVTGSWFYEMVELGYNYRLTDFQCGLGLSQLKKLDTWINQRREIARYYTEAFSSDPEIEPPTVLPDRESVWHLYVIRLNLDHLRVGRMEVFKALRAENIGVNVHYIPVPWHAYYQKLGYVKGRWPVAEGAYDRIISLPMWPMMSDQDVRDVVTAFRKIVHAYQK